MHKYFKVLSLSSFVVGSVLYFSGNETFFHKSGGTGLVILVIGTPLFAILALVFRRTGNLQKHSSAQSNKLLKTGLGLMLAGVLVYASAFIFIGDQGFDALGAGLFGAALVFVGLVTTVVGSLRK